MTGDGDVFSPGGLWRVPAPGSHPSQNEDWGM